MMGNLKLLVGFGAGYVLGARAGRERYAQIAARAQGLWSDPRVQEKAGQAQQALKEKADQAQQALKDKVGDKAGGHRSGAISSSGASGSGGTSRSTTSSGASSSSGARSGGSS